MTEHNGRFPWNPAVFAAEMQEAGEAFSEQQMQFFEQMMQMNPAFSGNSEQFSSFGRMAMGAAAFKTRVQSGGRLSIPDAEREALDIEEGDLVQAFVVPISRTREDDDE
jgi:DNA-binding transcriptional regulator/RsmH inhibitor MraZ